jgi:hypothetical protein
MLVSFDLSDLPVGAILRLDPAEIREAVVILIEVTTIRSE